MWDTSQINNWVMLCSPLSTGRSCSGEIKGVLWRLRHRSGTSSPWGLWKQKRGITGKREIGGGKKNKQDMLSRLWRRVEVVCKTRNGTWKSGSEQNIAGVWLITTESRPQKCHYHRAAAYFKGVEGGKKWYIIWAGVHKGFFLCLLETGQRSRLLWITETMSESLIIDRLTCSFITVTQTRCPETPTLRAICTAQAAKSPRVTARVIASAAGLERIFANKLKCHEKLGKEIILKAHLPWCQKNAVINSFDQSI